MKGRLEGTTVRLGPEGQSLNEQGGFGRRQKTGLDLAPEEALYLLHRNKIGVEGHDFDSLLAIFTSDPEFFRRFLVYRDIRERGYVIQPGPHDFRVFRRGERPGTGRSMYLVRVISERELINFGAIISDVAASSHMRKQFLLAVVDDEDELTYYEVKIQELPEIAAGIEGPALSGRLFGSTVITRIDLGTPPAGSWFGTRLDQERVMLSPAEAIYLMDRGLLTLERYDSPPGAYREHMVKRDIELQEKEIVYAHLRNRGYVPRTAYKFGHHFRVYSGKKKHSEMLVHAVALGVSIPMSVISRSVRLAHSVRKKMLFACVHQNTVQYIEFSRIKL